MIDFMTALGYCQLGFYPVHIGVFAYAHYNKTHFHGPVIERKTAKCLWYLSIQQILLI